MIKKSKPHIKDRVLIEDSAERNRKKYVTLGDIEEYIMGKMKARWGSGNNEIDDVRMDASTNSLQTLTYEHHEIHSGSSFHVSNVQNVDTTTFKWMVTTPDSTKYAHMLFNVECTGEMLLLVTEGADRTGGDALVEINRNRVGTPTAATVVVTGTPTGGTTDGATTILTTRVGSTGVGSKTLSGGGSRGSNEYVLKPNTKYIVSVTTYADVNVSLELDWYEHTDKH